MPAIESKITNVLLERPIGFTVNGRLFYIYPRTIGSSQLISSLLSVIEYDKTLLAHATEYELLRIYKKYPNECQRIIAYAMLKGRDCLDENKVGDIVSTIKEIGTADAVTLLCMIISTEPLTDIQQYYGIDKELAEYKRVINAKGAKGTYSYCGKSIYGTMIATLAEKFGWTMDYIVWGISLDNIQMLLADSVKTVFLTEEEIKKIHPHGSNDDVIRADDPRNTELILSMNWD